MDGAAGNIGNGHAKYSKGCTKIVPQKGLRIIFSAYAWTMTKVGKQLGGQQSTVAIAVHECQILVHGFEVRYVQFCR